MTSRSTQPPSTTTSFFLQICKKRKAESWRKYSRTSTVCNIEQGESDKIKLIGSIKMCKRLNWINYTGRFVLRRLTQLYGTFPWLDILVLRAQVQAVEGQRNLSKAFLHGMLNLPGLKAPGFYCFRATCDLERRFNSNKFCFILLFRQNLTDCMTLKKLVSQYLKVGARTIWSKSGNRERWCSAATC